MTTIQFDRPNGHIVIPVDGRRALIDTGSQVSVADEPFEFLDVRYTPPAELMGLTPRRLSDLAGFHVDILLGTDVLRGQDVWFRWRDGELVFGDDLRVPGCTRPIETLAGVPLFPCVVGGRHGLAIFDTGAPLAYIAPRLVAGLLPHREFQDFHPFAGRFTTPVYRVATTVAGQTVGLEYGVPRPPVLAEMLRLSGAVAIVGGGLLEAFDCLVSWRRRQITWAPAGMPA